MPDPTGSDQREIARLVDEVEQLRTALETSEEENLRLVEDRDRLLRRITAQSRELQAANAAYARAKAAELTGADEQASMRAAADEEQEELRVAFEEMQVLTEELEVANSSLHETNRMLDQRVADRTRELAEKNAELTESELRFRTLVEGMPQLVWRAIDGGDWTWSSPQWAEYTGLSLEESMHLGWLRALHPDDRETAREAWKRADGGKPLEFEARIYHRAERRHRHFRVRAAATVGAETVAPEWLGTSTDIDDLVQLQERQKLLVAELQHRVRNILAVIRSVFGRTMSTGGDLEDLSDHFKGRLDSLARTQLVVTRNATGLVDLEDLIRDELASVGAADGPDLVIEGPDVALNARIAESIGLAIHELTTNALKYGALKVAGATLSLTWNIDVGERGERRLTLTWLEQGVPVIALTPVRRGFGSELIIEALPYRLGAETTLEFRAGGVRCIISAPLPDSFETDTPAWSL